ncbi:MAG: PAS domain S-box protein [Chloroflexi bacterium]|nr:PAS domain S-box protein [Chloroflexota bacterium]
MDQPNEARESPRERLPGEYQPPPIQVLEELDAFEAMLASPTEHVFVADGAGQLTYVSRGGAQLFGRQPRDLIGKCWDGLGFPAAPLKQLDGVEPPYPSEGVTLEGELQLPTLEGVRELAYTLKPLPGSTGRPVAVVATVEDVTERRRLAAVQAELAAIVAGANDAIMSADLGGTIATWNAAAERLLGYCAAEMVGRPYAEIVIPERRHLVPSFLERFQDGHRLDHFETHWLRVDGTRVPVSMSVSPIVDPTGRVTGVAAIGRDLTDRRLAEEAQRRLAETLENIRDGFVAIDTEWRYVYVNRRGEELPGQARGELLGRKVWDVFPELAESSFAAHAQRALETRLATEYETYNERLRRWLHVRISPWDGGIGAFLRDVGERKRSELALAERTREHEKAVESAIAAQRESEAHFRELFDDAPIGYHELDAEGRIQRINQTELDVLGYRREEVLGRYLWDFVADREREDARREILATLHEDASRPLLVGGQPLERSLISKDGLEIPVLIEGRTLRDGAGRVAGLRSAVQDVSRYKQLQDELRQAQKMEAVGQLAGGIAHDFANALTIVLGYSELLLNRFEGQEAITSLAGEIHEAGERAITMTRQLLAFSRRQELKPDVVNLNEVIARNVRLLRRLIREDVELIIDADPDLHPVYLDQNQFVQVLMNLVINARDAMPRGGKLAIQTANATLLEAATPGAPRPTPGPHVLVTVTDTGVGMDPETQARIFEPFFTTKEQGKGTGLGLAMVYGTITQSGGTITVDSEPDRGTTFTICLPQALAEDLAGATRPAKPAPVGGSETILIVEDHASVRALTRRLLSARGYRVLEASDGVEALRLLRTYRGPIDLVITDIVMPEMPGVGLANRLATLRPDLPVILVSGYPRGGRDGLRDRPSATRLLAEALQRGRAHQQSTRGPRRAAVELPDPDCHSASPRFTSGGFTPESRV